MATGSPDEALAATLNAASYAALAGAAVVTVIVWLVFAVNVTVSEGLLPKTALHGFVVPEHVDELRFAGALQPAKKDAVAAVAFSVIVAPLSLVVMLGEQVLVTLWEAAFVPVPPHDVGALT